MKYNEKKIQEMMLRMFRVIADAHFRDHKMVANYCREFKIPRSLGEDIAGYVQSHMPDDFNRIQKQIENDHKDNGSQ